MAVAMAAGEITYRGEVHRGEHEPIPTRDLFEAVQAKRAANAVLGERQEHLQPGILRIKRLQLARLGYVHPTELRLPSGGE